MCYVFNRISETCVTVTFLLSQTEDGRRLLHKAKEEGFRFVFDADRMRNEGAVGLCDYKNKLSI